jgi:hypothetical protein
MMSPIRDSGSVACPPASFFPTARDIGRIMVERTPSAIEQFRRRYGHQSWRPVLKQAAVTADIIWRLQLTQRSCYTE